MNYKTTIKKYVNEHDWYYLDTLYLDWDFADFKRDFLYYFAPEKRGKVRENLEKILYIYDCNYAHPDGFFDSLFDSLFRDRKIWTKAKAILTSDGNINKKFWGLGIL